MVVDKTSMKVSKVVPFQSDSQKLHNKMVVRLWTN